MNTCRMLKKSASGVLSSSKSSTGTRPPHHQAARTDVVLLIRRTVRPRGYASGFDSPAALLDDLFEHPATELNESVHILASRFSLVQGVCQHLPEHCEGDPHKNP